MMVASPLHVLADLEIQGRGPGIVHHIPGIDGFTVTGHLGVHAVMVRQAVRLGQSPLGFLGVEADQVLAFQQAFVLVGEKDADPDEAKNLGGFFDDAGQYLVDGDGTGQQAADFMNRRQEPLFSF